ncbi:MAG: hypothetical protein ABI780_14630 [Ardenticatenales bacterium]
MHRTAAPESPPPPCRRRPRSRPLLVAAVLIAASTVLLAVAADPGGSSIAQTLESRLYFPVLARRWPANSCQNPLDQATAVDQAKTLAETKGLGPLPGEVRPQLIAADLLAAVDYDERFGAVDRWSLLKSRPPTPAPWNCYWRVELRGDGRYLGERPGTAPFNVNHFVDVFAAEACDACEGMWLIERRTEPTATATATATAAADSTDTPQPTEPSGPTNTPAVAATSTVSATTTATATMSATMSATTTATATLSTTPTDVLP